MPLCFDLDGTLGSFDGGYALLRQALGDLWGQEPTAEELRLCRGSTDWELVDELHVLRFGAPLGEPAFLEYERACLARFQGAFHPGGRVPTVHHGLVEGLGRLVDRGHAVRLVSGNVPSVLAFKALALGVDPRIPALGSLPGQDRAGLIRRAMEGCPGPHLYVGDRPHDQEAARRTGIPFLGVGDRVPHPRLEVHAAADQLVRAVEALVSPARS
jgi:phosphoglycolate phosphatase-like HAD superfamily hydrolase